MFPKYLEHVIQAHPLYETSDPGQGLFCVAKDHEISPTHYLKLNRRYRFTYMTNPAYPIACLVCSVPVSRPVIVPIAFRPSLNIPTAPSLRHLNVTIFVFTRHLRSCEIHR